jgi:hypothetical protein
LIAAAPVAAELGIRRRLGAHHERYYLTENNVLCFAAATASSASGSLSVTPQ